MKKKGIFTIVGTLFSLFLVSCSQANSYLSNNYSVEINSDGYWVINGEVTNVKASGEDGHTPVITIGENGNWYVDGVDTEVSAKGEKGANGANGNDGANGQDGKDGVSVVSITKTNTNGNVDTYTILYSDDTSTTFTVTNGIDGTNGANGEQGIQGQKGEDGHTPVITIGENGNWYVDGEDTGVSAKGEKGTDGTNGSNGENGHDAPHYSETCTVIYDAGNGTLPDGSTSVSVTWGDCLTLPTPEYAGYNFVGWFTGDGVNDKQFTDYDAVFKDMTLYARYEEIHYVLPDFMQLETGDAKEYYLYDDVVKVVAKEVAGKSFDYWVNNAGGRDYNVVGTYTFGSNKNYKNVVYRDEATSTDGFEGDYSATFNYQGNEVSVTLHYDGKGYYQINQEGLYSLSGYDLMSTYTTYYTGLNENLFFESFGDNPFTFANAKFNKDVTMADGNTYSYIEAYENNLLEKDVKLWLKGNEYVEQTSFEYNGTLTGTVTSGDYADSVITVVLDSDGNGTFSCDGAEVTILTYSSYDSETGTYTLLDKYGEELTIVTASDGTITVKYGDYKKVTVTYEKAKYKYYGTFLGSYSDDEGTTVSVKLVVNEDGTGTYYEDDSVIDTFTITSAETEDNVVLYLNNADEEKTLKYDSTSQMYSCRLSDASIKNFVFTSSYKDSFQYAGTYTGTDSNETECVIVLNADWTGTYSEDGTKVYDLTVTSVDETSNIVINLADANDSETTFTLTKQTNGKFKGRLGDGSVYYTYTAA